MWLMFIGFCLGLRFIFRLMLKWDRSPICLVGKTAIVTGSNSGIGYYTALDFAKRGAKVILACRNRDRAEEARQKIIKATGNKNVFVRLIDLTSLTSVRRFAEEINRTEERLDILVNNAGAAWLDNVQTEDGLNLLTQVNYFAPFLLTNLLIGLLKKSAPSRIVTVASALCCFVSLESDEINQFSTGYLGKVADYSKSKLLNVASTTELARRLKGTGVIANSAHPGIVETEIARNFHFLVQKVLEALSKLFFKSGEQGAQTTIYLAVSKDVEDVSGEYFDNCEIAWLPYMPRKAKDETFGRQIWEKSVDFVKLKPEERQL